MRSFDPRKVGSLECRAWETYYRRKWAAFLVASVRLVRAAFGMNWPRTLVGAWLVLRANQKWAPHPDNDPDAARALMARFYRSCGQRGPRHRPAAAELEVEWWRAHREDQYASSPENAEALISRSPISMPTRTKSDKRTCGAPRSCEPRRWTSRTAGSRRAVIQKIRCWPRSAPCWSARSRRCWSWCTVRLAGP